MIDGFAEPQIIAALITLLVASYAAFFGWVVASLHRLDTKVDALTVAVSRLEGAVYYGLPEPRRPKEAQS